MRIAHRASGTPQDIPLSTPGDQSIKGMDGYALLTRSVAEFALADWGQNIPAEKYNEEELQRINGVHPDKKLPGREYIKVVE